MTIDMQTRFRNACKQELELLGNFWWLAGPRFRKMLDGFGEYTYYNVDLIRGFLFRFFNQGNQPTKAYSQMHREASFFHHLNTDQEFIDKMTNKLKTYNEERL